MRKEVKKTLVSIAFGGFSLFIWFLYLNLYWRLPFWSLGPPKGYFSFPNDGFFLLYTPLIVIYLIIASTGVVSASVYLAGRKKYRLEMEKGNNAK